MADRHLEGARPLPMRWFRAFGRFWWEFLIGDTPELFLGAAIAVAATAVLCAWPGARTFAAVVLPVLVTGVLTVSVWWVGRHRKL